MLNPSLDQIRGGKAPSVTELVTDTRIDSPHSAANLARLEEVVAAEVAGNDLESWGCEELSSPPPDPEAISRQVQAQASQLAEHLRSRQQELDHREAELNAWAAKLERDTRAAQLWLEERNAELEETAQPAETVVLQEEAIRRMAEALAERERRLAESESELETQRAALQQFHEQLTADRQLLEEESRAQRERLAEEEAEAEGPAADCRPQPAVAVNCAASPLEDPQIGFVPSDPPQDPSRPLESAVFPSRRSA